MGHVILVQVDVRSVMVVRRFDLMQRETGSESVKDRDIVVRCRVVYSCVGNTVSECSWVRLAMIYAIVVQM